MRGIKYTASLPRSRGCGWRLLQGGTGGLEKQGGRGLEELRGRAKGPGSAGRRCSEGVEEQNERD